MTDKVTRAELAEAVRELRAEVASLRIEQAAHQCRACGCMNWARYYYPLTPQPFDPPFRVTTELPWNTVTAGTLTVSAS